MAIFLPLSWSCGPISCGPVMERDREIREEAEPRVPFRLEAIQHRARLRGDYDQGGKVFAKAS